MSARLLLNFPIVRLCLTGVAMIKLYACRLFEPYIVQLMGKLLERFGDPSAAVRHATNGVARAVMANLSSQGESLQTCSWVQGLVTSSSQGGVMFKLMHKGAQA